MSRFGGEAGGMGFGFEVEAIRELLGTEETAPRRPAAILVTYQDASQLAAALEAVEELHGQGERAELLHKPCASSAEAQAIASERGCAAARWLGALA